MLLHAPAIGPSRAALLLARHGTPGAVRHASARELAELGLPEATASWLSAPDEAVIDAGLAWLEAPDHALVVATDEAFPPQLAAIPQPPVALFVAGDLSAAWLPQLAIVGSRSATRGGLANARSFSRALATAGLTITSGLAIGVDGAAHEGALEAGGRTVAVLATGLDRIYPARHAALAEQIRISGGALLSEYPPGVDPRREHFPARNRLIAGLSAGVLVVEASVKSGSLITARQALEQGREVFAVPGSIHNPVARGCHALIKNGAKLVETADDVLSELGTSVRGQLADARLRLGAAGRTPAREAPAAGLPLDDDYRRLLDCMGFDPVGVDQLVRESGLTVEEVSSMLLLLELDGRVEAGPGGKYCRIGEDHP